MLDYHHCWEFVPLKDVYAAIFIWCRLASYVDVIMLCNVCIFKTLLKIETIQTCFTIRLIKNHFVSDLNTEVEYAYFCGIIIEFPQRIKKYRSPRCELGSLQLCCVRAMCVLCHCLEHHATANSFNMPKDNNTVAGSLHSAVKSKLCRRCGASEYGGVCMVVVQLSFSCTSVCTQYWLDWGQLKVLLMGDSISILT